MSQICPETKRRFEALENLVHRLASAGGASPPFAGPIVPNEAAAQALVGLPDGKEVFVLSHRSIWTKRTGVAGVQGVPPLAAHEVIACTDGTGVLCRTTYSDPALRVGVNDIYIDPVLGNDQNTGLTALTAIKTGRELFRRWGWGARVEVGPNMATSPDGFLNLHVLADLVSPDSLDMCILLTPDAGLRIRGGVKTTLRTSTITAAPIAMNPAVPLGGTRLRLTDGALATWAPYFAVNVRGRFTNGPAAGGTFQPQMDVPAGPGAVDCSACQTTNEPGFSQIPTTVTPAIGNTYVIEELITVNIGALFDIDTRIGPLFGDSFCNIVDCHVPSSPFQFFSGPTARNGAFLNFYQCTFNRQLYMDNAGQSFLIACYFTDAVINDGGDMNLLGGGALKLATTTGPYIATTASLGGVIDSDFVSHGMMIVCDGTSSIGNAAAWNCAAGGINPGGHGFVFGLGRVRAVVRAEGLCWGGGNAGVGLRVAASSSGVGAAQNVTGAAGDLALASQVGGAALCTYWDTPTSTYLPVGGQALSWALIAAAKGAPGYGGGAHNNDQDARWVAVEAN